MQNHLKGLILVGLKAKVSVVGQQKKKKKVIFILRMDEHGQMDEMNMVFAATRLTLTQDL